MAIIVCSSMSPPVCHRTPYLLHKHNCHLEYIKSISRAGRHVCIPNICGSEGQPMLETQCHPQIKEEPENKYSPTIKINKEGENCLCVCPHITHTLPVLRAAQLPTCY
jgi:hypothetical protein